jgi:hypothetical protein
VLCRFIGSLCQKEELATCGNKQHKERPLLRLFKGYRLLVLGDREFHSIKLANWLQSKGIDFVLRQKKGTYVRQPNS